MRTRLPAAFLLLALSSILVGGFSSEQKRYFTSILSFGDSYADTGNLVRWEDPVLGDLTIRNPPYGETFFGHPSGRGTDGRLVLDFIADALGLPMVPPVLAKAGRHNFSSGANLAVYAAPALNLTYLQGQNISVEPPIHSSLNDQLRWFHKLKPSLCRSMQAAAGRGDCFGKTLFIMGVFGGNDYNYILTSKKTLQQARSYVPAVVNAISDGVERLIHHGARYVVVADMFPIGCLPPVLTMMASPNKAGYDRHGCLKSFNTMVSQYHNSLLRRHVERLQKKHPHTKIVLAGYYQAILALLRDPENFGFNGSTALVSCCGGGGPHNYNPRAPCGSPGATACASPSKAIYWDHFHLTDSAYMNIARGWLHGPYAHPPILHIVT